MLWRRCVQRMDLPDRRPRGSPEDCLLFIPDLSPLYLSEDLQQSVHTCNSSMRSRHRLSYHTYLLPLDQSRCLYTCSCQRFRCHRVNIILFLLLGNFMFFHLHASHQHGTLSQKLPSQITVHPEFADVSIQKQHIKVGITQHV